MTEREDVVRHWDEAMNRLDGVAAASFFSERPVYVDHRALGWDPISSRDALGAHFSAILSMAAAVQVVSDVVAQDGDRMVLRQEGRFRALPADGGGEAELCVYATLTFEGSEIARLEIFEEESGARGALGSASSG